MKQLISFIKEPCHVFTNICIWLLPAGAIIRLFEILFIVYQNKIETNNIIKLNLLGFFYDSIILLSFLPLCFFLFFITYKWRKKVATIGLRVIFSFMLFLSISLLIFYVNATFPLDSVFFSYSFRELLEIFSTSQTFVWWAYFVLLAVPLAYFFSSKIKIPCPTFLSFALWICIFISWFVKNADRTNFYSRTEYYTAVNKEFYFFKDLYKNRKLNRSVTNKDISDLNVALFQSYFKELEFVNPEYPFLHKEQTPDNLSPFFKLNKEPPHIVLIIVEGLGSEFSGPGSRYPSPTLFIDSLANTGLYWQNCLTASPRTVGVLPAIFGALPYGTGGFMKYQLCVPDFHSLPLILKKNGYRNAFFYGGWMGFDDMKTFTNLNHFTQYSVDYNNFSESQKTRWGLLDRVMFEEAIKAIDFSKKLRRFDVYLTLTTHEPFDDYPDPEKYMALYRKMVAQATGKATPPNTHIKFLASYIYADESVRHLINLYSKEKDFEHTIFIITGDHHFDQTLEQMPSTHVPLIIWSPMIHQTQQFNALVSHREITPSILALLRNNYNFKTPEHVAWLNTGLDTQTEFTSNIFLPQMAPNRAINYFAYDMDYIVLENDKQHIFYKKEQFLGLQEGTPVTESNKQLAHLYQALDRYVMENDKLIDNKSETLISKVYYEINKREIQEISGIYPMNIVNLNVDFSNLHSVDIFYEFDIKIESDMVQSSVTVVTQMKNNNDELKHYMNEDIFRDDNKNLSEWVHFAFHYTYKNNVFTFKENKKMIAFLHNPENIPHIQIKNLKTKVIINSYK